MTYRSIDLQLSVARSQETGTLQSNLQHRQTIEQSGMVAESIMQTELSRSKTSGVESATGAKIKDQHHPQNPENGNRNEASSEQTESNERLAESPAPHPFKGKHIDFSL